jgi:hypothetical protein
MAVDDMAVSMGEFVSGVVGIEKYSSGLTVGRGRD